MPATERKGMSNIVSGIEVAPFIHVYDNAIDNCQEIIDLCLEQEWSFASLSTAANDFVRSGGPDDAKNIKYFDIIPTVKVDPKWFWLLRSMWQRAEKYGAENKAEFSWVESLRILHYAAGQDSHNEHYDSYGHDRRVVSGVLFLNDVDEGGEIIFPKFNVSIQPKAGRFVIFPSNFAWHHDTMPPISNEKFCIAVWFTN